MSEINLDQHQDLATLITTSVATLLHRATEQELGIFADDDSEFLHRYRVSLRKVRTMVVLFQSSFKPQAASQLKNGFGKIMNKSSVVRDLDVFLQHQTTFGSALEVHAKGLESFYQYLGFERQQAFERLCSYLHSKKYQRQKGKLLGLSGQLLLADQERDISKLLPALIAHSYQRGCKLQDRAAVESGDRHLHRLRIQCKRLRYALEAFTPLLDSNQLAMIKPLKHLQDSLGDYNDRCIQLGWIARSKHSQIADKSSLKAIGQLEQQLLSEQLNLKLQMLPLCQQFFSDKEHG